MRSYLYETHMHTTPSSACGRSFGREYIARYQDFGFDGIMITDHFFRGNCGIDRRLPWRERVHRFCEGYEDARNEGEKRGFPVLFGWEENYDGDEYLVYGLDEQWMLEHPEMEHWTRLEQFRAVHEAGGCVVQAHPFRARSYISTIHLSTGCVDAIEGVNAANDPAWNTLALRYAELLRLPVTAGSDNHCAALMTADSLAGVVLDKPLTCIGDFVQTILQRRPMAIRCSASCHAPLDLSTITLPVDIRGAQDQPMAGDIRRFLSTGCWQA